MLRPCRGLLLRGYSGGGGGGGGGSLEARIGETWPQNLELIVPREHQA